MICLVVGPSASGKSAWAEAQAAGLARQARGGLLYLATMRDEGPESHARVERHRRQRAGKGFSTVAAPTLEALTGTGAGHGQVGLLDDLGNLVANEMFTPGGAGGGPPRPEGLAQRVCEELVGLSGRMAHLVVVADEVGSAGWRQAGPTLDWVECCGTCCCMLAQAADEVVEVRCGVATWLRGGPHGAQKTREAADA